MNEQLVILGAGGFARQIPGLVRDINLVEPTYDLAGFLAPEGSPDREKLPLPVLGDDEYLRDLHVKYVIGIGIPRQRAAVDEFATQVGRDAVTLVHPQSSAETDVDMAPGCIILPGVRIQTGTSLHRHVLVNANAVVGHDCRVGEYSVLSPLSMLAGHVHVGARALIGAGAVVLPGRRIGEDAIVGAGAVVTDDVACGSCAVGVPARTSLVS